ncbi:MAG: hypothetical protein Q9220_001007 [cf. Caloplaca sp. 1 TL-2023]
MNKKSGERATNLTSIGHPVVLLTISERAAVIGTGGIVVGAAAAVANFIATIIKNQSGSHSCGVVSGNVNGMLYQYSATGRNCDTTSEQKTINSAVQRAINFMTQRGVNQACFELKHGGTWRGDLQLAAGGRTIIQHVCEGITYTINI